MARRKKVKPERKDRLIKAREKPMRADRDKGGGPFTANLKLDMPDFLTISHMQKSVGNKAVQRYMVQRMFPPQEDLDTLKGGSTKGLSGKVESSPGAMGLSSPQVEQEPTTFKGMPVNDQEANDGTFVAKGLPGGEIEGKAETQIENKVGDPGMPLFEQADQVDAIEAHDRPTLYYGSRGPAVVALQRQLRSSSPGSATTAVDGIFGPITREHVIAFQEYMGLKPDGIVGSETWRTLDYISKGEDIDPEEQKEIKEDRLEALDMYQAGDFKSAKEGFEEVYLSDSLKGKPLQRAGLAYNIGLCIHQLAAKDESGDDAVRDTLFKDAMSWYFEAAHAPGKAARIVDIQADSLERIRECRAKEPPSGEPFGLDQLDKPEKAIEDELEDHEAK